MGLTLYGGGSGGGGVTLAQTRLTRTAVKTADYTAAVGDLVPVNTTGGAVTITLPTTPVDKSTIAVKMILQGGTNTVTVICGGADTFNRTSGASSLVLSLLAQSALVQYDSSSATWTIIAADVPLGQLDLRYPLTSDSRLSDARTPTAHATSHNIGGSDALTFPTRMLANSAPTISPGIVNTTTETNIFSCTVASASTAAGDLLIAEISFDQLNNSGSAVNYQYKFKLGATTVFTSSAGSVASNAARNSGSIRVAILLATTSDQRWSITHMGTSGGTKTVTAAESWIAAAQSTEDLTSDKTLAVTVAMATANAATDLRPIMGTLFRVR